MEVNMTNDMTFLRLFPGLIMYEADHYLAEQKGCGDFDDIIMRFCNILDTDNLDQLITSSCRELEQIIVDSKGLYESLQDIETHFSKAKTSFNQILSMIAEKAILSKKTDRFGALIEHIANTSQHPVYQFLNAWIKFNLGHLKACIHACKKADTRYGPILGLLGQVYMETGSIDEAVEALKDASELLPHDILTWYLLAKALLQFDKPNQAHDALEHCLFLNSTSSESLTLMIETTKHQKASVDVKAKVLARILKQIEDKQSEAQYFIEGMLLSMDLQDKNSALNLIESANFIHLMRSHRFRENLGGLLLKLQGSDWKKVQIAFIDRTKEGTDRLARIIS
jgi:tetratricopeptide (TPR) repeat protein